MTVRDALEKMLAVVNSKNVVIGMTIRVQKRLDKETKKNPLGMEMILYKGIPVIVFESLQEEQYHILEVLKSRIQVILLHDEMLDEGWV